MAAWESAPAVGGSGNAVPSWQSAPTVGAQTQAPPKDGADSLDATTPAPSGMSAWQQAPQIGGDRTAQADALYAKVIHDRQQAAAAGNSSFEDFGNALGRTLARPIEGAAGLITPAWGEQMRQQNDFAYPTRDNSAGAAVGNFTGNVVNAPLALHPVGRLLSAAEAAGNSRINTAQARTQGADISGANELANASGSAGLDLATNFAANKLLGATVGSLGKTLAPGLAAAAVSGDTGAVTAQLVKALAARMGTEAVGNDLIGRAHTLAQNLVNKATTNPDQSVTEGQGWENEVNAGLQTLLFSGLTAPHSIGEAKYQALERNNANPELSPEQRQTSSSTLFPKGGAEAYKSAPPVNTEMPVPSAETLQSLKTSTPEDNAVSSTEGQPARDEAVLGVQGNGQNEVSPPAKENAGRDTGVPEVPERASGGEGPAVADSRSDTGVDETARKGTGRGLIDDAEPKYRVTDGSESRGVPLEFADPEDKALYLATVPRKGKVAAEAISYLKDQGYAPEDIEHYGSELRDRVEESAKIPPAEGHPLHIEADEAKEEPKAEAIPAPSELLPGKPRNADDDIVESANKGAYRVTSGLKDHQEYLDVHKELTGQEAVPYAGGRGRGFRAAGKSFYNVEQNNTPQLRREAIAHEATHALQDTRPDLVHQLDDAIPLATREKLLAEYQKSYQQQEGKSLDPAKEAREIQAMAVGRVFSRPNVAREVMQNDPGIFRRGADALITKLRGLTSGGKLTNEVVKFLRTAREGVTEKRADIPDAEAVAGYNERLGKVDLSKAPAQAEKTAAPESIPELSDYENGTKHAKAIRDMLGIPDAPEHGEADEAVNEKLKDFTPVDRRVEDKPVDPEDERRFHEIAKGATFEAPAGVEHLPGQATAKKFVDEDVTPKLEAAVDNVRSAWEGTKNLLGLQNTAGAMKAKGILRERGAELAQRMDRLNDAFTPAKEAFDKVPQADTRDFIDKMEKGKPQTNPKLQPIADALRGLLDDRLKQVQSRGKLQNFVENYFPHLWADPKKAASVFSGEGRTPMEGRKSFLRQRSLPLFSDGIAKGLEPVTENPVEAAMLRVREMDKFITADDALKQMKSPVGPNGPLQPLLKKVPARGAPPEGYAKINDAVGTIYAPPNRKGGVSISGYYVAPEAVASVINNNLSPGLRGNPHFGGLFRAYLGAGNVVNQASLGLSAFHAATSTFNSALSEFGLGTKALFAGRFGEAGKRLGLSTTLVGPAVRDFWQGSDLLKEWNKPGSTTPEIAALVDSMKKGGGRAGMDTFYHTGMTDKMMTAFRQGNTVGGLMRLPMAGLEQAAKPIMEYLVPRLKMGAYMQMARFEMASNPSMSHEEMRSKMGDVWNSVDNRFGQMVHDNVFWNHTIKDLSMASVRSVGWNLGTFRELGGGVKDFATMGKRLAMDRSFTNVEMTHRMAYTAALPVLSGLFGGMLHYAMTGDRPKELKDLFFPKTGDKDANGDDTRYALPTYMKDVYGFAHNPVSTIANKTHPMLNTIIEMMANKDYYGTKIRNEDDPLIKQAEDELKFAGKSTLPISLKDAGQFGKEGSGVGKAILPMLGLTHAPSYVTRTPAENMASDLEAERMPRGSRTQAQVDKGKTVRSLADLVKAHDTTAGSKIQQAIQGGQISSGDVQQIRSDVKFPTSLTRNVSHLDMPSAMKVWESADDDEKLKLGPILFTKLRGSKSLTRDERVGYLQTLQEDWKRLKGVSQ